MKGIKIVSVLVIMVLFIFALIPTSNADDNRIIVCYDQNLYKALCDVIGDKIVKKDDQKMIIETEQETVNSIIELDLSNKNIRDLKGLECFTNLISLDLSNNDISNLVYLSELSNIQTLQLNNNNISDLTSLVEYKKDDEKYLLSTIYLNNNKISDVSTLTSFEDLVTINLTNNLITDISSIASLGKLKNLYLGSNRITDISSIANNEVLEILNLDNNRISSISELNIKSLRSLNLRNNQISDVYFLKGLVDEEHNTLNLQGLDLSYNQILIIPEGLANWINNKYISDIKMNNQKISVVSPDVQISFGKNSSYTNILYFGFFFTPDLETTVENGKLDTEKLVFSFADLSKAGRITVNDGIFKDTYIKINYGGSADIDTAKENTEKVSTDNEEIKREQEKAGITDETDKDKTSTDTSNTTNTTETSDKKDSTNTKTDTKTTTDNKTNTSNTATTSTKAEGEDETTASGKMPYTGITSRTVAITGIVLAIVGVVIYTFSQNKKNLKK